MVRRVLALAAIVSGALVVPGASNLGAVTPPSPIVTSTVTLTAPDATATGFGSGFSIDEHHAVVAAKRGTKKVVYVFDRNANATWTHTATIVAPTGATLAWGAFLSVSGDTIAVGDTESYAPNENYGSVEIFDLVGGTWTSVQTIRLAGDFLMFAQGVWLSNDGLVIRNDGYCDSSCNYGSWHVYKRNAANQFVAAIPSALDQTGKNLTVGADNGRFALGNPGFVDEVSCSTTKPSRLMVTDTNLEPPKTLVNATIPFIPPDDCSSTPADWFRRVDISGNVLAYDACCTDRHDLHVLRDSGSGFKTEAVLPIAKLADALLVVPDVILRADAAAAVFHTHVFDGTAWAAGNDIPFPAGAVVSAPSYPIKDAPVAAGNLVAIKGAEAVHILTVVPHGLLCLGQPVTVVVALGQTPTSGDDVILGTGGDDNISAGGGNDRVCSGDGNDTVAVGEGNDIVDAGTGNDVVNGGYGNDILSGADGNDLIVDGAGNNVLAGGAGNDRIYGGTGNDALGCGSGTDYANGGAGTDAASGCEVTVSVP